MRSIRGKPAAALFVVSLAAFVDLLVYGMMVPVLPGYASGLGASQSIFLEGRKAEVQLRKIPLPRTPLNKGIKKGWGFRTDHEEAELL